MAEEGIPEASVPEKKDTQTSPEAQAKEQARLVESFARAHDASLAGSKDLKTSQFDAVKKLNLLDDFPPRIDSMDTIIQQAQKSANETTQGTEKKSEKPTEVNLNNSVDQVMSGVDPNKTAQKEVGQITKDLEKSNPDQTNKAINNMDKLISGLPEGLKKFFTGILDFIKGMTGIGDKDLKVTELEKVKDAEQRKILDKYGVKVETPANGTNNLTFNKDAKIQGEKTMKPTEPIDTTKAPEKTPIKLKNDNNLSIDFKNATSADVKDNDNGFTLTINNKDGSIDTYKVEFPLAPAASPESKTA